MKKITKEQWVLFIRRAVVLVLLCALLGVIALFSINSAIIRSTEDRIVSVADAVLLDDVDCILVLGCGVGSEYLADRLDIAFDLYFEGVSDRLLMSGDHGTVGYDEVNFMLECAVEKGIDREVVFTDHAGFSTYESIYRALEIFEADKIVIVSQEYHLYRALYLAGKLGIEAYGVSATTGAYGDDSYQSMRESLARFKDFFYALLQPEPTFLGESIPISGNASASHD